MAEFYNIKNGQKIVNNTIKAKAGMDLPKELAKIIEEMKSEIKNRSLDSRYSGNFAVNFDKGVTPNFYAKNIALFIERDLHAEGESFLGISVLHPTMPRDARIYLTNGNWNQLLEYISKPDFKKELEKRILELSEDLKTIR